MHFRLISVVGYMILCAGTSACAEKKDVDVFFNSTDMQNMEEMIKKNPDILNAKDANGNTRLILSCISRDIKVMSYLLKRGAEVSIQNRIGDTALDHLLDSPEIADLIFNLSGNIDRKADWLLQVMHRASYRQKAAFVEILRRHGVKIDFESAVHLGLASEVEEFIKKAPQLANSSEVQPLHFAALHGHLEVLKVLLKYRANVNAPAVWCGTSNVTPIVAAVIGKGCLRCVNELLNTKADPSIKFTVPRLANDSTLLELLSKRIGEHKEMINLLKGQREVQKLSLDQNEGKIED